MRSFLARLRTRSRKSTRPAAQTALPSFHPSFEQLESRLVPTMTYHGGPLLTNVGVEAVFYGADWQNNPTLNAQTGDIANFLSYIVDSPYMDMLSNAGYGVGRGAYLDGTIDPQDLSGGTDDATIQNEIVNEIGNGALQPPDANRLYFVFVQPGTAVAGSELGAGYHTSFTAPDGSAINYAVVNSAVDPTTGAADWNAISGTGTHELAEAVTDSDNGWWDDDLTDQQAALGLGTEIADIVNGQAVYLNGYQVSKVVDQNDVPIQPDGSTSLLPTGQDVTATAGQPFTGTVATFQEVDVPGVYGDYSYGDYSAQIAWGDGQTSAGQIVDNGNGTFNVIGTNTYAQSGSYTIQVSLADNADGDVAATSSTATVNPGGNLIITGQPVTATTGQPWTATVATFQDADGTGSVGDYTAQLDYGDGNTGAAQIVDNGNGTYSVVGSDTYAQAGTYTIQVSLTDNGDGDTGAGSSYATVTDPGQPPPGNPTLQVYPQNITVAAGAPWTTTVATFQESDGSGAAGDFAASVDYGDGNTGAGQIVDNGDGTFSVLGSDTYALPGSYTIQVAITDPYGATATATDTATATGPVTTTADVAATPATQAYGYPFTLTAAVTSDAGVPVGTVSFLDGTTFLGADPLGPGGTATLTVTTLAPGDHTILAVFSGGGNFESSTSAPAIVTILAPPAPAATGTAVAANPATPVFGYPFTLTAAVTSSAGVPVGTVSFLDGATFLGAAPLTAGGTATLTVTTLAPGNHTILAVFGGGGNFASSTSPPAEMTVLTATATGLAASPTRAAIGQPLTLSVGVIAGATVPTGTVTFLDNGSPIGTVPLGPYGNATLNVTGLGQGSYRFTAQFNGTGDFASSTSQAVTASVGLAPAATVGAYDPTTGIWYLRNSNTSGAPDAGSFAYGGPGYLPVVGDWTGDGVDTIGVYEEATGTWLLKNSNTSGAPDIVFNYGGPGYLPVVGDWTGDGIDTVGVYNVATGQWLLRNSNTPGAPDITFAYGGPGYLPVVGDWTGSGKTTVGVYAENDGAWLLKNSNTSGAPDIAFNYGGPGMTPVVGDWNGQGITTVGVFDTGDGTWLLKNSNTSGPPDLAFAYGVGSWTPVAGAWTDQPQAAARVVRLGSDAVSAAAAPEATATPTLDELTAAGVDAALAQRRSEAADELAALLVDVPPTAALDQVFAALGTETL